MEEEFTHKPEVICDWDYFIDILFDKKTRLFIDSIRTCQNNDIINNNNLHIMFEPNEISGIQDRVIENSRFFNKIFTFNHKILDSCENSY